MKKKQKLDQQSKSTYPMCMTFFKSEDKSKVDGLPDLFVFALVSDIAIYKLQ